MESTDAKLSLELESLMDCFGSPEKMDKFAAALAKVTANGMTPVITYRKQHLVTAISPEESEAMFVGRIVARLGKNPEMLATLERRLSSTSDSDFVNADDLDHEENQEADPSKASNGPVAKN